MSDPFDWRQHLAHPVATEEALDRAVQLLFDAIVGDAIAHRAGRAFLETVDGMNREVVVRHAAERLRGKMKTKVPLAMAERAVWGDVERLFDWTRETQHGRHQ